MFEKPLGLRENPFLAGHHPKYLFPSREHQEALAHLRYGIQNREPFVLITGEVGTGKTTAVYDALAEWGSRAVVALITNSALSRSELMEEICLRFGVSLPSPVSKPQALVELQRQLTAIRERGELAILLVDEAQNLDRELLEEIRLLSNLEVGGEYLLQIFLVGQPELETKLAQKELRQLRQRIGIHYRILPLSNTEGARYIHHRVSVAGGNAEELFPPATCAEIYRITNGIPREINVVAGQSLLNAFVDDARSVTVEHVRAVEKEIEFQSVLKQRPEDSAAAAAPAAVPAPVASAPVAAAPPPAPAAESESRPRLVPPPPPVSEEDEVEMTEAGFHEASAEVDDVLEDDLPDRTLDASAFEPIELARPAAEVTEPAASAEEEERSDTGIRRLEESEPLLPSWIDEIVRRRQAIDARMAELAAQSAAAQEAQTAAQSEAPADLPPPIPLPTAESYGFRRDDPVEGRSGALLASPAPERIAPHPADPIPLFKRPSAENLPPRLRNKLDESTLVEEENEKPRRMSMAWPIAGVVLAAVAIAALLLVRFGPWTLQPRETAPVNTPTPTSGDSSVHSSTPYPPFDKMNQPSSALIAKRTPPRRATVPLAGGAPPTGDGAQTTAGAAQTTSPSTGAADPGTAPGVSPTGAAVAGGAVAGGAAAGGDTPGTGASGADPASTPTYGIAVGTYMNEARAISERSKIREATKLSSRVMTVTEDNVAMYRVVVGNYTDRTAAERAASNLVQRGLVEEARVVAMARPAPKTP